MRFRITEEAVEFLERHRTRSGLPAPGIRIYRQAADGAGEAPRLAMCFTDTPAESDHRVEQHGIWFYVDPDVADELGDAVIDFEEPVTAPPVPPPLHIRAV